MTFEGANAAPGPRRYAVLGAGAIGSVYGSRLWQAGHPLRFGLRSDWEEGRARGLRVESPWGDLLVPAEALCDGPAGFGPCDVLLIALKTTANDQLSALLAQLPSMPPCILLLQNGLGGEELVASIAPGAVVLGGICEIACSRIGPAHVRHYAYGLVRLAPLQASVHAQTTCAAVAEDLSAAGIPVQIGSSLGAMRWHKLVWNMAFSGLCTLSGRRTQELLADASLRRRLLTVMQEVVAAAAADGVRLAPDVIEEFLARTAAMPTYAPSMQLDAEAGRPLELEAIYRVPLQRARRNGVAMPETALLLRELEALAPSSEPG